MSGLQSCSTMGQAAIGGDITKDRMTRIRRKYLVCESCDGLLGISPNQLYSKIKIFLFIRNSLSKSSRHKTAYEADKIARLMCLDITSRIIERFKKNDRQIAREAVSCAGCRDGVANGLCRAARCGCGELSSVHDRRHWPGAFGLAQSAGADRGRRPRRRQGSPGLGPRR